MTKVEPITIDLDELLKKGNLSRNLLLKSGDLIFFPSNKDVNILEQKVYISGLMMNLGLPGLDVSSGSIL
jgi:hypothetical protein